MMTGKRSGGFTLTSLIVAMAVLSLVIIGSMELFNFGRKLFIKSSWRQTRLMEMQDAIRRIREDMENASNKYSSVTKTEPTDHGFVEIKQLQVDKIPFRFRSGTTASTSQEQALFDFSLCQLATMEIIADATSEDYNEGSRIDVKCSLKDGELYYMRTRYNADDSSNILFPKRPICRNITEIRISSTAPPVDPDVTAVSRRKTLVNITIEAENPQDPEGNKTHLTEDISVIINVEARPDL